MMATTTTPAADPRRRFPGSAGALGLLLLLLLAGPAGVRAEGSGARDSSAAAPPRATAQPLDFNARGGDRKVNRDTDWGARQVAGRVEVTLRPVEVADAAEAVSRGLAEQPAGRHRGGAIDLIWITGETAARRSWIEKAWRRRSAS